VIAYRGGVQHLHLFPTQLSPPHTTLLQLADTYPNLQSIEVECSLGDMIITVILTQWHASANDRRKKSGKKSGLGKVLVKISNIKAPQGYDIIRRFSRIHKSFKPTINSADARMHIIDSGRDESVPFIDLYAANIACLLGLLGRLDPAPATAVFPSSCFVNVIDLRCLVASIQASQLQQICEMMPQLRRLHIVIKVLNDELDFEFYPSLCNLRHLESLGMWFTRRFMWTYPDMPYDLAERLQSLNVGWSSMLANLARRDLIFPSLQELVIWFDIGHRLESFNRDPNFTEDLAQRLERILQPRCQVKFRYITGTSHSDRIFSRRELDEIDLFADRLTQWEFDLKIRRSIL
jgi:hypothetical protein